MLRRFGADGAMNEVKKSVAHDDSTNAGPWSLQCLLFQLIYLII
jgi:hypothetical protein